MKTNQTFSIDIALAKLLKEERNQSGIVNRLLENYFSEKVMAERDKEEKEKINKEIEKDLKILETQT